MDIGAGIVETVGTAKRVPGSSCQMPAPEMRLVILQDVDSLDGDIMRRMGVDEAEGEVVEVVDGVGAEAI